jgi:hypothetical protein
MLDGVAIARLRREHVEPERQALLRPDPGVRYADRNDAACPRRQHIAVPIEHQARRALEHVEAFFVGVDVQVLRAGGGDLAQTKAGMHRTDRLIDQGAAGVSLRPTGVIGGRSNIRNSQNMMHSFTRHENSAFGSAPGQRLSCRLARHDERNSDEGAFEVLNAPRAAAAALPPRSGSG